MQDEVTRIRSRLDTLAKRVEKLDRSDVKRVDELRVEADSIGSDFLRLEKCVP